MIGHFIICTIRPNRDQLVCTNPAAVVCKKCFMLSIGRSNIRFRQCQRPPASPCTPCSWQSATQLLISSGERLDYRHLIKQTAHWFELHHLSTYNEKWRQVPTHNKKNRKEGEDLSRPVQFFLPSLPGVYGWVTSTIFGGGQSVK